MECSDERMKAMEKRAPRGWIVKKHKATKECYYYHLKTGNYNLYYPTPNDTPCPNSGCSVQGGYKTRKNKSRTQKRRN
jgi:hypothetical protein